MLLLLLPHMTDSYSYSTHSQYEINPLNLLCPKIEEKAISPIRIGNFYASARPAMISGWCACGNTIHPNWELRYKRLSYLPTCATLWSLLRGAAIGMKLQPERLTEQ